MVNLIGLEDKNDDYLRKQLESLQRKKNPSRSEREALNKIPEILERRSSETRKRTEETLRRTAREQCAASPHWYIVEKHPHLQERAITIMLAINTWNREAGPSPQNTEANAAWVNRLITGVQPAFTEDPAITDEEYGRLLLLFAVGLLPHEGGFQPQQRHDAIDAALYTIMRSIGSLRVGNRVRNGINEIARPHDESMATPSSANYASKHLAHLGLHRAGHEIPALNLIGQEFLRRNVGPKTGPEPSFQDIVDQNIELRFAVRAHPKEDILLVNIGRPLSSILLPNTSQGTAPYRNPDTLIGRQVSDTNLFASVDNQGQIRMSEPQLASPANAVAPQACNTILQGMARQHAAATEELSLACPSLLQMPDVLAASTIIKDGDALTIVCPAGMRDRLAAQFTEIPLTPDMERIGGRGGLNEPRVAFTLPSVADLERRLFQMHSPLTGHFDASPTPSGKPAPESTTSGGAPTKAANQHIPRMPILWRTLLELRVPAEFTWDEGGQVRTVTGKIDFSQIHADHYVVVTLPTAGVRFLVSNDPGKGFIVLQNTQLPAEQFIGRVNTRDMVEQHGATTIHFDTEEQFARALRTAIPPPGQPLHPVYPVDTRGNFTTPLNDLRFSNINATALSLLRRDWDWVAKQVGKADRPWDVTISDFESIRSGERQWHFGGIGQGMTYLNRIARELGMVAREDAKPRPHEVPGRIGAPTTIPSPSDITSLERAYRNTVLAMVAYELFPEYRAQQQSRDTERLRKQESSIEDRSEA